MGAFTAKWLRQREPADHRARDAGLLQALATWCSGRENLSIVDLGCGTGSNARAMIPHLPGRQHWRLLDHDEALLAVAREEVTAKAGSGRHALTITLEQADFAQRLAPILASDCDLVTAAALFDLVSKEWLDDLVDLLAARSLPLYTVLVYDGTMEWQPAHPADEALRRAFNAHQRRDKGFGPAAGPEAGKYLASRLGAAGFQVATAPSPWRLGPDDHALLVTGAVGVATAAREMGDVPEAEITDWLDLRRQGGRCTIGHVDLLALPLG